MRPTDTQNHDRQNQAFPVGARRRLLFRVRRRAGVPSLKTKGPKHFAETMQIAERIMDERRELFRRLADA